MFSHVLIFSDEIIILNVKSFIFTRLLQKQVQICLYVIAVSLCHCSHYLINDVNELWSNGFCSFILALTTQYYIVTMLSQCYVTLTVPRFLHRWYQPSNFQQWQSPIIAFLKFLTDCMHAHFTVLSAGHNTLVANNRQPLSG